MRVGLKTQLRAYLDDEYPILKLFVHAIRLQDALHGIAIKDGEVKKTLRNNFKTLGKGNYE